MASGEARFLHKNFTIAYVVRFAYTDSASCIHSTHVVASDVRQKSALRVSLAGYAGKRLRTKRIFSIQSNGFPQRASLV